MKNNKIYCLLACLILPVLGFAADISELVINDTQHSTPYLAKPITIKNLDSIRQVIVSGPYAWAMNHKNLQTPNQSNVPGVYGSAMNPNGLQMSNPSNVGLTSVAFYDGTKWHDAAAIATPTTLIDFFPVYPKTHTNANAWILGYGYSTAADKGRLFHFDAKTDTWSSGPSMNELFHMDPSSHITYDYNFQMVTADGIACVFAVGNSYAIHDEPVMYVCKQETATAWSQPQILPWNANGLEKGRVQGGFSQDGHAFIYGLANDRNTNSIIFKIDDLGQLTDETSNVPWSRLTISSNLMSLLVDGDYVYIGFRKSWMQGASSYVAYKNSNTQGKWFVSDSDQSMSGDPFQRFGAYAEDAGLVLSPSEPSSNWINLFALNTNYANSQWSAISMFNSTSSTRSGSAYAYPTALWMTYGDRLNDNTQERPKVLTYNRNTEKWTDTQFLADQPALWSLDTTIIPISIDAKHTLAIRLQEKPNYSPPDPSMLESMQIYSYDVDSANKTWNAINISAIDYPNICRTDTTRGSNFKFMPGEKIWLFNDSSVYQP